jgi:hypothetical protein
MAARSAYFALLDNIGIANHLSGVCPDQRNPAISLTNRYTSPERWVNHDGARGTCRFRAIASLRSQ